MKDFKTNSGARVVINPAPYRIAKHLRKVLLAELKNNSIGLKISGEGKLFDKNIDFTGCLEFLKNVLIGAEISEEIENAIFECLAYCTYKTTHKITEDLFDELLEIREDEFEIKIACVEENLKPFIKSLVSSWRTLAPKLGESQALNVLLAQMNS